KGLAHLENLTKLRILFLRATYISGEGLTHLRNMKQLRKLDLSEVPGITDDGLESLTGMRELVWLNLWNTRAGNAGMEHVAKLSNLLYLNLDNTGVDDEGLK